jgi:drug/metabolite transporter (DMT)-like permease
VQRIGESPERSARYSTIGIVGRTYPVAAIAVGIWALISHDQFPQLSDTTAWGGILAMALISQMLGHTALNAALRTLTSTIVAMTTLLEPIVAALLAAWLFSERLSPLTTLGGVLVLAGIALLVREEGRAT